MDKILLSLAQQDELPPGDLNLTWANVGIALSFLGVDGLSPFACLVDVVARETALTTSGVVHSNIVYNARSRSGKIHSSRSDKMSRSAFCDGR